MMGRLSRWLALASVAAILACRGGPRFAGEVAETAGDVFIAGPEPQEIWIDTRDILWEHSWIDENFLREIGSDFDAVLDLDGLRPAPVVEGAAGP